MFHEGWIPKPHIPCRNTLGPCIWPSKDDFWAWLKYCLLERCILADISWNCLLMSFLSNSKVFSKRFSCKNQPTRIPCQIACYKLFKSRQNVMHFFFFFIPTVVLLTGSYVIRAAQPVCNPPEASGVWAETLRYNAGWSRQFNQIIMELCPLLAWANEWKWLICMRSVCMALVVLTW